MFYQEALISWEAEMSQKTWEKGEAEKRCFKSQHTKWKRKVVGTASREIFNIHHKNYLYSLNTYKWYFILYPEKCWLIYEYTTKNS